MDSGATEMQPKPADKDSTSVEEKDRPPDPPKRDYTSRASNAREKRISSFKGIRAEFIDKPENGDCMGLLKSFLIVFNLLIWLFGAIITGLGIWVKVDRDFWDIQTGLDMKQFSNAGYVLIATGVIIMVIGFVGCYGAMALKMWMLVLYAVVLVVIILMEIAVMGIVWSATNNKDVEEELKQRGRKALQDRIDDESQSYLINLLQTKLGCCGIDGPDDYGEGFIPRSCINTATGFPHEEGCLGRIVAYFKSKAAVIGGVAITVFILELGAIVMTLCVACGLKQAKVIY